MSVTRIVREAEGVPGEQFTAVLTLDVGGTERRFSTESFSIPKRDGSHVRIDGGLMGNLEIPARRASVRDASIALGENVSVQLQAEAAQWLQSLAQRAVLQAMAVEVAIVAPDLGGWDDRIVVYEGVLRHPSWDLRRGTASFEISQIAADAFGRVPSRVVSNRTFSTVPGTADVLERSVGEPMPLVYGARVYDVVPVTVAQATNANVLLINSAHVRTTAGAINVNRDDSNGPVTPLTLTATNGKDATGLPIATVLLSDLQYFGSGTTPYAFHVDLPGKLGAIPRGSTTTSELRYLGDILLDLLLTYSGMKPERIAVNDFRALNAQIPIELSLQITQEDSVLGWVSKITQDLPVTIAWVGGRLRALAGRLTAETGTEVAAHLRWGHELLDLLGGGYEEEPIDDIANSAVCRYKFRNREGRYSGVIELNQDTWPECKASAARYGARALERATELWMIEDGGSAQLVARDLIARKAHLRTRASYLADSLMVAGLEVLMPVLVTDETQGVISERFIVEELRPQLDGTTILGIVSRQELGRH